MRIRTILKACALCVVLFLMVFIGLLAYHSTTKPMGRIFDRFLPGKELAISGKPSNELVALVGAKNVPEIDPGAQYFDSAKKMLALGRLSEAKNKLSAIIANHPRSERAKASRRIVGQMNLDELLSSGHLENKVTHFTKHGESYDQIAKKYRSNAECLLQLNMLMDTDRPKVDSNLVILPMDFQLTLEVQRKVISLWSGNRYFCEFPVIKFIDRMPQFRGASHIESRLVANDSLKPGLSSQNLKQATKVIWLASPTLKIQGWDGMDSPPEGVILLDNADMEDLFLLTRVGNEVVIR